MTDAEAADTPPLPLHHLIEGARLESSRSRAKNEPLEAAITQALGVQVAVKIVDNVGKNLDNRVSEVARRAPTVGVLVLEGPSDSFENAGPRIRNIMNWRLPEAYVLVERIDGVWRASRAYMTPGVRSVLEPRLLSTFPGVQVSAIQPAQQSTEEHPSSSTAIPNVVDLPFDPAETVDERTLRMLRLSLASATAVMLVGPPGTGKTRLVDWVINEAARDPASFGFAAPPTTPIRVTPEESWTTRDLVGGLTIDAGELRFRQGHVLRAIQEDRWLVLDEANRADMDRIFGALLTWLTSEQDVDLGPASSEATATQVAIGWSGQPACEVQGLEALSAGAAVHPGPIAFRAGRDWRLLGTYNTLDAQRVFRFGHALGRRFGRVPVPALEPERFQVAVQEACGRLELPGEVAATLHGLYSDHYADPTTRLGHGLFLVSPPRYVARGLAASTATPPLHDLLAEGYLIAVGTWLAAWEDRVVSDLRERVVNNGHLSSEQWNWVVERLGAMR